jgi:hypothetical protein
MMPKVSSSTIVPRCTHRSEALPLEDCDPDVVGDVAVMNFRLPILFQNIYAYADRQVIAPAHLGGNWPPLFDS